MAALYRLACFAVATLCFTPIVPAQDAAPEPTAEHEMLALEAGQWTGEMKMFINGPDADPIVMPCAESNVMMDTGLWLISQFEAGPFKGHGQFGYDPARKKFVGSWIDNQTPSLGIMEGTHDAATGETTYLSKMMNPATGKMEPSKSVSKMIDKDTRHFVMYMKAATGDGWTKSMEINYKRKK